MTNITFQQAVAVLPAGDVHLLKQPIENIAPIRGITVSRGEAESLLAAAEQIMIDNTLEGIHTLEHRISIKQGKGIIFFQTEPGAIETLI